MASGIQRKTPVEEIIQRQGGESAQGQPGESVKITGGQSGSGLWNPQASGIAHQNYNIMDNGRLVINPGIEEYKWNDRLKRYDAVPGMGRGYLLAEKAQAPAPAPAQASGGGGGIVPKANNDKPAPVVKPVQVYDKKFTAPLTTNQILGDTKQTMLDWRPISSNGNGGVQQMNPLVDPNSWLYQGKGPAARKMTLIPI